MIFAEVTLEEAEGAILAHSISCSGERLKKGTVLRVEHLLSLRAAGTERITVARLTADDIDENAAAEILADALLDHEWQGLSRTVPFTGRVNLIAESAGIVEQDVARLVEMNKVDPMISCATVPQYQQMAKGGLVATVKIISYSVPKDHLEKACALARGAIRLRSPIMKTAALLISDTEGGAGDKGLSAISARLEALGITLNTVERVPHDVKPLAQALERFETDLVLILTSSATSDIHDTAPAALRLAGGQVSRFGMPVDPGNLLFLGSLKDKPVIGLPGCARSPALNGADWVLSRVACGVACDSDSFAEMSVGGLLKEILTRPQPRRPKSKG